MALGSNTLTVSGGGAFAGAINGTGGLTITGGTETLSGTSTYTGGTSISGGATVVISANANLGAGSGSITFNNGTLQNTADVTMTRNVVLTGNAIINTNSGTTLTDSTGIISGAGALTKNGIGTLVLGGASTYTGGTTLNAGTLKISADNNLGAAAGTLMINGGTLENTASLTTNRAITMASNAAITTDTGTTLTQGATGTITGTGTITKNGAGTLVLGGDNSGNHTSGSGWTGGMTINAGTVQVTNGWGLGWGVVDVKGGSINATVDILTGQTIALAGGTSVNTNGGTTTTLTGTIGTDGSGSNFVKTGTGTLTFATGSTSSLNNGVDVQQGTVLVNGAMSTGSNGLTVESGSVLGGSGYIASGGGLTVWGTLKPGNSPGFLTMAGTVTQMNGSTFQEDIAGTTQASASSPIGATGYYSFLHVTGAGNQFVINNGSTLAPMLKNIFSASESGYGSASFVPSIGQTFRIVTADAGVVGRFTTLTQPDGMASNTRFAAFYNVFGSNSIDLEILPASYSQWLNSSNANTRSAASALDKILATDQAGNGTSAQDQLLYVLGSKTAASLPGFVTALAGEVHGALAAVAPQAGQWLQGSVARQLGAASASGSEVDQNDLLANHALWVDIGSNHSAAKADGFASSYSSTRSQFAAGVDVLSNKENRLGVGISHGTTNVAAALGSGSVDENMGFAYGQYAYAGFLFDGLAGYGTATTDSQRADPTGLTATLKSSQGSRNALVSAGIRAPWRINGATFEPFARVMWQQTRRDAYNEGSSVAALSFDSYTASGVRSLVGMSGSSAKKDPLAASNTYQFSVGIGQDSGSLVRPTAQASLAGMDTTIAAPQVGRAFVQANLSGTYRLGTQAYAYGGLTGEARSGRSDLAVNGGVRVNF